MTVSYFLNHRIVFRSPEEHSFERFARFFAVTGFGILAIQTCVIYAITHLLAHQATTVNQVIKDLHLTSFSPRAFELNIAKLCAVAVAMLWNFIIYHLVVFKRDTKQLDEDILL